MDKRFYVEEEGGKRLDVFLLEQTDEFTRSRIKKLIESGQVRVNGAPVNKAGLDIKAGYQVELLVPDAVAYTLEPENIPIDIISGRAT